MPMLLVTLNANPEARRIIAAAAGTSTRATYLADLADTERAAALSQADVLLARNTAIELRDGEAALLRKARLIQFVTAGVDYIPLAGLPGHIAVASNGGAYAEPMAEHAMAMALAALKRLFVEHAKLAAGTFDQFRQNRMLAGSVCGILGFGGIGVATARLMRGFGAHVHAINRRGSTDEPVDWIGATADLDRLLGASDILVLALPLTPASRHVIGARELGLMKRDAILINLARGEIVEEAALYAHLVATPEFTACIDAWWIEPVRHGTFRMDHDFMRLPNVIASPHNSASVGTARTSAMERAMANVRRVLDGGAAQYLVPPADRMM